MTSNRPYLIRAIFEWICDNHLTPFVVARADAVGLKVPPSAVEEGRVVLNLGPDAVTRFEMGHHEISFLARFAGVSNYVVVPIDAVVALYARENGQGMMFPADLPAAAQMSLYEPSARDEPVVKSGSADSDRAEAITPSSDSPPPKRGGHLKVIK